MQHRGELSRYGRWQERWREPILTALLVLLLCEIFFNIPITGSHSPASAALAIVWFLLVVATTLIATRTLGTAIAMILSAALALVANALRLDAPSTLTICVGAVSSAVFMLLLICVVWAAVDGPGPITHHRIRGAVVIYLSIALGFAALYELLIALIPGAITTAMPDSGYMVVGRNFMYYSLATLTTIGDGGLSPVHPLARSLTTLEALIGQLFPAIYVARIIALETRAPSERSG